MPTVIRLNDYLQSMGLYLSKGMGDDKTAKGWSVRSVAYGELGSWCHRPTGAALWHWWLLTSAVQDAEDRCLTLVLEHYQTAPTAELEALVEWADRHGNVLGGPYGNTVSGVFEPLCNQLAEHGPGKMYSCKPVTPSLRHLPPFSGMPTGAHAR
ncbi:hypothetical protein [Luteibacter aegosomatissinici]|uniref:hypothetical protein n=1 Tax=Luteibacter aegosomatissinici TaxID=2911539 RepID=UPI001FF7B3A6|nr:hypothetical protein [Luteibacter aegosomatissinici]UPG92812.1 hypothetical protein L2Y97_13150 [Luteibacter aegosomatissinici]